MEEDPEIVGSLVSTICWTYLWSKYIGALFGNVDQSLSGFWFLRPSSEKSFMKSL